METTFQQFSHIKGWGVDADPQNEPTYPMKKYTGDDHNRIHYPKPPQQKSKVEVLHSNERPGLSSVYGTSVPPKGLSGIVRRFAFRFSEGSWGHWLPLLLADRINVWEGIAGDVVRGRVPNVFAELGGKAEWKYNKRGLTKKVLVGVLITSVALLVMSADKNKKAVRVRG